MKPAEGMKIADQLPDLTTRITDAHPLGSKSSSLADSLRSMGFEVNSPEQGWMIARFRQPENLLLTTIYTVVWKVGPHDEIESIASDSGGIGL